MFKGADPTILDTRFYNISYINNVNKGKATILINGDGVHSFGSRAVTFTIKPSEIKIPK